MTRLSGVSRYTTEPALIRDLLRSSARHSTHAGRPYLSGLSILWSPPLICRFAHAIRETLSAAPIFCRISRIIRRNIVGSIRRPLHTCLSVLPPARARSMIDSSLVRVGSSRNPGLRLMLIRLCSCFIGSPILSGGWPPPCDAPLRGSLRRSPRDVP